MIEHVFDLGRLTPEGRSSVLERALHEWGVDEGPLRVELFVSRSVLVLDGEPHGSAVGSVEPELAEFARLLEAGAAHLGRARVAHLAQCREAAVQARELAAFAAKRPAVVLDRPDEQVGAAAATSRAARPAALTAVSEWAVDEVMVAFGLSSDAASRLLAESITLVERLPATLDALSAGLISWPHARMLAEVLAPMADAQARAEVEQRLLTRSAGKTVSQLRVAARRAVLRADAAAAVCRLAAAVRARAVRGYPGEDGMGTLSATMPLPVLRACTKVLEAYAEECAVPDDERTKEQRMVDCLIDLLLRPDGAGRPPVQVQLTLVASTDTLTGGDEPGEVDGQPVPALLVRELAHSLGLLPKPQQTGAAEITQQEPPRPTTAQTAKHETAAPGSTATETAEPETPESAPAEPAEARVLSASETSAARLADLLNLRTTAGTALAELPTIAVIEEVSGQLLALTRPAEIRRRAACKKPACRTGRRACTHPPAGAGLGPPPDTPGYRPSAALQRFVRARDRRCRFPGCRARAERCDLDHTTAWPAGATSCDNLCCLCRHHHRLSHQAPGWTMHRLPDGGLAWTTPGGDRLTTHPPRFGTDDDLPPPTATPVEPLLTLRERVLGRPATPEGRENDPPPF
jgi:hypothetical protein